MLKFFKKHWLAVLTFLLCIIAVLGIIILGFKVAAVIKNESRQIADPTAYQAVFLTNNQTYFGQLIYLDSQFLILDDVYYVRLTEDADDPSESVKRGTLVRLGQTEPHGPENQMVINRDHILFWEDLRADSQVMKTIEAYKSQRR